MDKNDLASNALIRTENTAERYVHFWAETFHTVLHQGKSATLAANEADMALAAYKLVVRAHLAKTEGGTTS